MVYMCGGTDESGYETNRFVSTARYSVRENRWWALPSVNHNRRKHTAIVYRSHLVMAGGIWYSTSVLAVEALALDPATGHVLTPTTKWVDWPVLHRTTPQSHCSLAVLDDRLYASYSEMSVRLCLSFRVLRLDWGESGGVDDTKSAPTPTGWTLIDGLPQTLTGSANSERYLLVI